FGGTGECELFVLVDDEIEKHIGQPRTQHALVADHRPPHLGMLAGGNERTLEELDQCAPGVEFEFAGVAGIQPGRGVGHRLSCSKVVKAGSVGSNRCRRTVATRSTPDGELQQISSSPSTRCPCSTARTRSPMALANPWVAGCSRRTS